MSSRSALGPTQPHIKWVPGALSPGVKQQGREADHSPPTSGKGQLYLTFTIRTIRTDHNRPEQTAVLLHVAASLFQYGGRRTGRRGWKYEISQFSSVTRVVASSLSNVSYILLKMVRFIIQAKCYCPTIVSLKNVVLAFHIRSYFE
jgi:hypothetical protein